MMQAEDGRGQPKRLYQLGTRHSRATCGERAGLVAEAEDTEGK